MIDRLQWSTGEASGGAGVATATGYSPQVEGHVLAVYVDYVDSPPAATCDFALSDEADPASESIVTIADSATDAKFYPRRVLETNDGTDLTYDGTRKVYGPYLVHGRLEATIAQVNADDYAIVTVCIRK